MEPIKYFLLADSQLDRMIDTEDKHSHNTISMALELKTYRQTFGKLDFEWLSTDGKSNVKEA